MKLFVSAILFSICNVVFPIENSDTLRSKLYAGCTVSLNSNGIASIPAFSLDKPAIMASVSLAKGRFSYSPILAYGLDLKPWFIDNWLHYKLIKKPAFELRAGFNISTFFSDYKLPDEVILQGQRYFAFAVAGTFFFSSKTTLTIDYWNDRGQDKGTIMGHFVSLTGERSEIMLSEKASLTTNVMLFYIDYDGKNDGLFISPKVSFNIREVPFSLFSQASQAIISNIEPFPGFRWNIGVSYTF
jgi:hypothetical protein